MTTVLLFRQEGAGHFERAQQQQVDAAGIDEADDEPDHQHRAADDQPARAARPGVPGGGAREPSISLSSPLTRRAPTPPQTARHQARRRAEALGGAADLPAPGTGCPRPFGRGEHLRCAHLGGCAPSAVRQGHARPRPRARRSRSAGGAPSSRCRLSKWSSISLWTRLDVVAAAQGVDLPPQLVQLGLARQLVEAGTKLRREAAHLGGELAPPCAAASAGLSALRRSAPRRPGRSVLWRRLPATSAGT